MAEVIVLAHCPKCDRLSANNMRHCLNFESWAKGCKLMVCTNPHCRFVYAPDPAKWPGYHMEAAVFNAFLKKGQTS